MVFGFWWWVRSFFSTFAKPKITKNDNGRKVIVITLPERLQDKVMTDQGTTTSSLPAKRQLEFVIRLKKEKDAKLQSYLVSTNSGGGCLWI